MSPFDFINACQLFIALMFLAWLASLERAVSKLAKQGSKAAFDLVHLENEHVKLECKVGSLDRATTRLERSLFEGDSESKEGGGPYRTSDHVPDVREMVDEEPPFVPGQDIDMRVDGSTWFRAQFRGVVTPDARTPFVRVTCGTKDTESFALSRIEMRHARAR